MLIPRPWASSVPAWLTPSLLWRPLPAGPHTHMYHASHRCQLSPRWSDGKSRAAHCSRQGISHCWSQHASANDIFQGECREQPSSRDPPILSQEDFDADSLLGFLLWLLGSSWRFPTHLCYPCLALDNLALSSDACDHAVRALQKQRETSEWW